MNHQRTMGKSETPQIVERPRSGRDRRRVPRPKFLQERPQRTAAAVAAVPIPRAIRPGAWPRGLVLTGEFDDGPQQVGMNTVGGVGTQAEM